MNSGMIPAFKVLFWSLRTSMMSHGAKYYEERYSWRGGRGGIGHLGWAARGGVSGQRKGQAPGPSPPLQLADAGAVVTVGSRVAKFHHSYVTASQERGRLRESLWGSGVSRQSWVKGLPHVYC